MSLSVPEVGNPKRYSHYVILLKTFTIVLDAFQMHDANGFMKKYLTLLSKLISKTHTTGLPIPSSKRRILVMSENVYVKLREFLDKLPCWFPATDSGV